MASGEYTPDSLAKRLFLITIVGVFLYIAMVFVMVSSGDKAQTDRVDRGVATALAP